VQAVTLNGAAVERNLRAFEIGRWVALHPAEAEALIAPSTVVELPKSLEDRITYRADHLVAYQGKKLARKYRKMLERFEDIELREAVAEGYHKLLAYKDEYEVARLLLQSQQKASEVFDGDISLTYHLAPPSLTGDGTEDGRPAKKTFGPSMKRWFRLLARMKGLRGTVLDPFGRTAERQMERALIAQYEDDMAKLIPLITPSTRDAAIALARLPLQIRGFGPVKAANEAKAAKEREALWSVIRAGGPEMEAAAE
jgi:indolepyruvate ferredoxin oxidoreductase